MNLGDGARQRRGVPMSNTERDNRLDNVEGRLGDLETSVNQLASVFDEDRKTNDAFRRDTQQSFADLGTSIQNAIHGLETKLLTNKPTKWTEVLPLTLTIMSIIAMTSAV